MGNIREIQDQFSTIDKQHKNLKNTMMELDAKVAQVHREIASLKQLGVSTKDPRMVKLQEKESVFQSQRSKLQGSLRDNLGQIKDFEEIIRRQFNPIENFEQFDASHPLLLFPLRLETRFKTFDYQKQLWLRIYPDECNIIKNEPLLTSDELSHLKLFYAETALAEEDESKKRAAWKTLVHSFGANRAAWIKDQYLPTSSNLVAVSANKQVLLVQTEEELQGGLKPEGVTFFKSLWLAQGDESQIELARNNLMSSNLTDWEKETYQTKLVPYNLQQTLPTNTTLNDIEISIQTFPSQDSLATQSASWNQNPYAKGLPDKFVVIMYHKGIKTSHIFSSPVKYNLPVGLNPSETDANISKDFGGIHLNDDLKWMVDFFEAEKAGMATLINLSDEQYEQGFDQIFVVGLKVSTDAVKSKELVEELFTAHQHDQQGFEFIKQGTATNNTDSGASGYTWVEDSDESYDRIFKGTEQFDQESNPLRKSDGQVFAEALNLSTSIFQKVRNANGKDQLEAKAMNKALFPATMGYFMEEMLDPIFQDQEIQATQEFFANYVSGRGPIPAFKIGRHPYGVLPVTQFNKLEFTPRKEYFFGPYPAKVKSLLQKMDALWETKISQVSYLGKSGDPHQILLNVLGLHPNSVDFHQRYAQSLKQVYNQLKLQFSSSTIATIIAAGLKERGKKLLMELGVPVTDELPPIAEKFFISKPNPLKGPLIDDAPESEVKPIRNYSSDGLNYIEWLQQKDGNKIRLEDFGGNEKPNALLYLLLRHALLLSQSDAASSLLLNNGLITSKKEYFDSPFLYIADKESKKSKFDHLYQTAPQLTGDRSLKLVDHIYQDHVLNNLLVNHSMNQILQALKVLEKTPTARLERLLIEHLDCCTYRLDAWKTGLTNFKLQEKRVANQRQQKEAGLYLGAYGILMDVRPSKGTLIEKQLSSEDAEFFKSNTDKITVDTANLGYIHAPSIDQAATAAILRNNYESFKGDQSDNPFAINLSSERVRLANDFLEGMRNGQTLQALLGYQFERGLHDLYEDTNMEADKFIFPLRMAFPLIANKLTSTALKAEDIQEAEESNQNELSIEAIEARNVLDGIKLIEQVLSGTVKTYPFGNSKLPAASPQEQEAIHREIDRIIDINDAIADLLMAEQVYQAVKGNFERASGVAEAFSKGSYPPEMEVIQTPRSGITLNHKLAIHFNPKSNASVSPLPQIPHTIKSKLEPSANEWLASLLPSPDLVQVKVNLLLEGQNPYSIYISQQDLGLQSIDLIFAALMDNEQAMTLLDDRIVNYIYYKYKNQANQSIHPFTKISIEYTAEIDPMDKSKVSLFELGSLLGSLKKILINRPHVNTKSLELTSTEQTELINHYDIPELKQRMETLRGELGSQVLELETHLASLTSKELLKKQLETDLIAAGINETMLIDFQDQLHTDLENYFFDPKLTTLDELLQEFELKITSILNDPLKQQQLRNQYEIYLKRYQQSIASTANDVKETCRLFMKIAQYDHNLTGTGYFHTLIGNIYQKVSDKLNPLITYMDKNLKQYDEILLNYHAALTDEEKIILLKNAERQVSSFSTVDIPTNLDSYKLAIENKAQLFKELLEEFRSISTKDYADVHAFLNDLAIKLDHLNVFVNIPYDIKTNRNDLKEEYAIVFTLKEDLSNATQNLFIHLQKKIDDFDLLIGDLNNQKSEEDQVEQLLSAAKKLIGEEILIIPKVLLSTSRLHQVDLAYQKSDDLLAFSKTEEKRVFPIDEWLSGLARVRTPAWHLENSLQLSEAFKPSESIELKALQFPIRDNDRWLALKFIADQENQEDVIRNYAGESLIYTAHFAKDFDVTDSICGIIIDEWTEIIPFNEETTGITFHYNEPNSEPPQTLLLVTPSHDGTNWDWEDLVGAMEETVKMTKQRGVEPSMIDSSKFGQFLPTTLMAVTSNLINISVNLALVNKFIKD